METYLAALSKPGGERMPQSMEPDLLSRVGNSDRFFIAVFVNTEITGIVKSQSVHRAGI